jgi:hypothetical protein
VALETSAILPCLELPTLPFNKKASPICYSNRSRAIRVAQAQLDWLRDSHALFSIKRGNSMNQHLREQRRIAAQAFLESLEHLGDQIRDDPAAKVPLQSPQALTMDALEAAALDIEHLLEGEDASP